MTCNRRYPVFGIALLWVGVIVCTIGIIGTLYTIYWMFTHPDDISKY